MLPKNNGKMTKKTSDKVFLCQQGPGNSYIRRWNADGQPPNAVYEARQIDVPPMDGSFIYQDGRTGKYMVRTNEEGQMIGDRFARPVDFSIYPVCFEHRRVEWECED